MVLHMVNYPKVYCCFTNIKVKKAGHLFWSFEKIGRRQAMSIALVSLAALLRLAPGGLVEEAHLAWGSVGPTVMSSSDGTSISSTMSGALSSFSMAALVLTGLPYSK